TSPTRPPAAAVTKHQSATKTRSSVSRRLNIADDRTHATCERVHPAGPVGRGRPAQGSANRLRDRDRGRDLPGPASCTRVRLGSRGRTEAEADARRTAGRALRPAIAARARTAHEAN